MILVYILLNLAVVSNVLIRAFDFKGRKFLGHIFEALMIGAFMTIIILAGIWAYELTSWQDTANLLLMYVFIRAGLFNALWGLIAVKRWYHLGFTPLYDRILTIPSQKWGWPQRHYLFWYYLICYLLSVGCLTNGFLIVK